MLRHEGSARVEPERESRGTKQLIALLALAFVVTLGVVVGTRMSSDAIAVLVGVIAGVAASIPCALLLMAVTRRRERDEAPYDDMPYAAPSYPHYRQPPPVIVVTPGAAQQQVPYGAPYGAPDAGPYGMQSNRRRQFRVMGYEEEDDMVPTVEGEIQDASWRQ